jgi:hypothetical protein
MKRQPISEENLAEMVTRVSRDGVKKHAANGGRGGGAVTDRPATGTTVKSGARTSRATIQSFFVPGPLPGANDIIRKHHMIYSRLKAKWGLAIGMEIMVAKIRPVRACAIQYHWIEPIPIRGHIRDRDNIRFGAKFINDALVGQGILLDDGPDGVISLTDTFAYDASHPGVWVTLEEVPHVPT